MATRNQYRLIKELWAWTENRIAVRFAYEWCDGDAQWFRSYGNEIWDFAADGRMSRRIASINDLPLTKQSRLFHWPSGRRPYDHPGLTELNLGFCSHDAGRSSRHVLVSCPCGKRKTEAAGLQGRPQHRASAAKVIIP
jgi:hypothetical protein